MRKGFACHDAIMYDGPPLGGPMMQNGFDDVLSLRGHFKTPFVDISNIMMVTMMFKVALHILGTRTVYGQTESIRKI